MLLVALPRPDVILLQLPPALPTMVACWMAARRHAARLVFDWHNFAFTLMAIDLGRGHPLVRLAERYERSWARAADASLCVTKAMQQELLRGWGVEATVFYDRPPSFFRPATPPETHKLCLKLHTTLCAAMHPNDFLAAEANALEAGNGLRDEGNGVSTTILTRVQRGAVSPSSADPSGTESVSLRPGRPAIVITSTSWTSDEDFSLLLRAARLYDAAAASQPTSLPRLIVFVTGRGPQRSAYEAQMRALDLRHVAFRTVWLEPGDYPLLLGSADLGVSLHASSSGLDLPMKVVDMFGCGLPACVLSYSCIGELVTHGRNGLLFTSGEELAEQLQEALRGFSSEQGAVMLQKLHDGVANSGMGQWGENWTKTALPVLRARRERDDRRRGSF
jgi:beta-1,4-mannosyltransferase